ncbi:receptor activity-modifying protein 1-like [Notolabrus celidotus]|uniref:receptor activity-modifying protein 1-like n=1 Tax=Notolabrus celidotus TaxID=1203425 RepID=UPI0014907CB4|nr:receptor activity-modifying protein 1-like [Notolabrus celidotus]XP_034549201.1 receptor activity-modifying protein 1-like [Notolabrus celidotus]
MVPTAYFLALPFIWTGIAAKLPVLPCDQLMFDSNMANCLSDFNRSMEARGYRDSCPWPEVKGIYNKLKLCVDDRTINSWCSVEGFLVDKVFLGVHQTYFHQCGQVQDPPLFTLIMLIAPPIVTTLFMPILCFKLTTWET